VFRKFVGAAPLGNVTGCAQQVIGNRRGNVVAMGVPLALTFAAEKAILREENAICIGVSRFAGGIETCGSI
jgi:hypothetical protein